MKGFIDRMYCFYDFDNTRPRGWTSRLADQGRKAAVIGICEQLAAKDMGFVMEAMEWPLQAFGYDIVDSQRVFGVFSKGELAGQPHALDTARQIGRKLGETLG
jgi:hypothetical protein